MSEHFTTETIATELGLSKRRVREIAQDNDIGTMLNPRMRLFTAEDKERIRNRGGPTP